MRRLRYNVAMSLDGYIASPAGDYDWITMDPAIDFSALFAQFDCLVMGRKTFEATLRMGSGLPATGHRVIVFSTTLSRDAHPGVDIVAADAPSTLASLKSEPGKDIWLFGGGVLFGSLLDAGVVDTVEVAIMPILLGRGAPLLAGARRRHRLRVEAHRVLASGITLLTYATASA